MAEILKSENKTPANPVLSIIIVNYNVKEYILNCIQSIQDKIDANRCPYEVIVSDNGSVDGSVEAIRERFPWVKVIKNNANLGFSKANNIGAKQAKGEVLFFLNPDTLIIKGIEEMGEYVLTHQEVGLVGAVTYQEDGISPQSVAQLITPFRLLMYLYMYQIYNNRLKRLNDKIISSEKPYKVDYISGANMLIRKALFLEIGLWDEKFFLGHEDHDLCIRINRNGYDIIIFPSAGIIHLRGRSYKVDPFPWLSNSGSTTLYYYHKHFHAYLPIVYPAIFFFHVFRLVISYIKKLFYILTTNKGEIEFRNRMIKESKLSIISLLKAGLDCPRRFLKESWRDL